MSRFVPAIFCLLAVTGCVPDNPNPEEGSVYPPGPVEIRIATYNLEDVRSEDVESPGRERLEQLAAVIQEIRPDILLLNEIAHEENESGETNAYWFARNYLSISQGPGLTPLRYVTFSAPSNTGVASGFDLDNSGTAVSSPPPVPPPGEDGSAGVQTSDGRAYGNDAWGFGTFPGQYAMALMVREDMRILEDEVRTFQLFPWKSMPDAMRPLDPVTGEPWYSSEEWNAFRLSSKSHWDVPVVLPNGSVLHVLLSHPTPPAFDGPERRNVFRNHDEIRFWADYVSGAGYIVDDSGVGGGLDPESYFVVGGDLNADPDEGRTIDNPIGRLLSHPRIAGTFTPEADSTGRTAFPNLSPDDTAIWGMRVDYVLPSNNIEILQGGIRRPPDRPGTPRPSDHFPVWLDVRVGR